MCIRDRGEKVNAAGGRTPHIEERQGCSQKKAGVERCQEGRAGVGRKQREDHIHEKGAENHGAGRPE